VRRNEPSHIARHAHTQTDGRTHDAKYTHVARATSTTTHSLTLNID